MAMSLIEIPQLLAAQLMSQSQKPQFLQSTHEEQLSCKCSPFSRETIPIHSLNANLCCNAIPTPSGMSSRILTRSYEG